MGTFAIARKRLWQPSTLLPQWNGEGKIGKIVYALGMG